MAGDEVFLNLYSNEGDRFQTQRNNPIPNYNWKQMLGREPSSADKGERCAVAKMVPEHFSRGDGNRRNQPGEEHSGQRDRQHVQSSGGTSKLIRGFQRPKVFTEFL